MIFIATLLVLVVVAICGIAVVAKVLKSISYRSPTLLSYESWCVHIPMIWCYPITVMEYLNFVDFIPLALSVDIFTASDIGN